MFKFRPETNDRDIYTSVVHHNEYRLAKRLRPNDIVIDVGAHIGSFAEAVLQRGCQTVYCIEADVENVRMAAQNLQPSILAGKVTLIHSAMWRSDPNDDVLFVDSYPQVGKATGFGKRRNTGGASVLWGGKQPTPKIALDEFVLTVTNNGARRIRLLKLDCEGAELPILMTATTLHLIDEICGEFHELGSPYEEIGRERPHQKIRFSFNGSSEFSIVDIVRVLNQAHFTVSYHRHRLPSGLPEGIGLFFATQLPADLRNK